MKTLDQYVYDRDRGSWVLNTNNAANKLGYEQTEVAAFSMATDDEDFRRSAEPRSAVKTNFRNIATKLDGSASDGTVRKRKSRRIRRAEGSGFYGSRVAVRPYLPFKAEGMGHKPFDYLVNHDVVRRLPDACAVCVHRPACSSWISGRIFCRGIHLCLSAKPERMTDETSQQ